jgi:hypothetical protein
MLSEFERSLLTYINVNSEVKIYQASFYGMEETCMCLGKIKETDWSSKSWQGRKLDFLINIYDRRTNNLYILDIKKQLEKLLNEFVNIPNQFFKIANYKTSFDGSYNMKNEVYIANFNIIFYIINK